MGLLVHTGARRLDRRDLKRIETPAPMGARHKPIPHSELAETLVDALRAHGMEIRKEEWAYREKDSTLVGWIQLDFTLLPEPHRASAALGLIHSNKQKTRLRISTGANVFVCDNLMMLGNRNLVSRKHTVRFDWVHGVWEAVGNVNASLRQEIDHATRLDTTPLTADKAKEVIFDGFRAGAIPYRQGIDAWNMWVVGATPDVRPRTFLGLYQAGTRSIKSIKDPVVQVRRAGSWGEFLVQRVRKGAEG